MHRASLFTLSLSIVMMFAVAVFAQETPRGEDATDDADTDKTEDTSEATDDSGAAEVGETEVEPESDSEDDAGDEVDSDGDVEDDDYDSADDDADEASSVEDLQSLELSELLDMTVVSASRQAEPLREAPVPVTVITSEMIRAINARNLEDVLVTYVPGMVSVEDGNEENVAFRGIYASSQQKFLVMVNGHRINHRAYLAANPDEGISVNPNYVKQIEVLRGPGSSVYGNVALNAVVNIITKSGAEIDGAHARVGVGNYGQLTADLTYGTSIGEEGDLVVWGNIYDAEGEEYVYSPGEQWLGDLTTETPNGGSAFVESTGSPTAHDVGLQLTSGAWTLLATHRVGRHSDPLTNGGRGGDIYERDELRTFMRNSAGLTLEGSGVRLTYDEDIWENFNLRIDAAYDRNAVNGPFATNRDTNPIVVSWQEDAYSLIAQGRLYYDLGGAGEGNLLTGVHADVWWLRDSFFLGGADGEYTTVLDRSGNRLLRKGQEGSYSAFAQLKHAFSDSLLFNAGARFDYKTRRRGAGVDPNEPPEVDDITVINPRVAILYSPTESIDLKLSFADAFVDSPYWYRYNILPTFAGSINLEPERYRSLQFTPSFKALEGRLVNTINVAWNQLRDGIYRVPDAQPGDPFYLNSGVVESISIDEELAYLESWYRVRVNASFFQVLDVEEYTAFDSDSSRPLINERDADGRVWHIPQLTGNLVFDVNPFFAYWDKSWFNVTVRYIGERQAPIDRVSIDRPDRTANRLNEEPATILLNAGVRLTDLGVDGLNLHVYGRNILGEQWFQGGSSAIPYPQAGFWYMAQLEYRFTP